MAEVLPIRALFPPDIIDQYSLTTLILPLIALLHHEVTFSGDSSLCYTVILCWCKNSCCCCCCCCCCYSWQFYSVL